MTNPGTLPESIRYCVVGAGIHGLSTAWHLARELKARGVLAKSGEFGEPRVSIGIWLPQHWRTRRNHSDILLEMTLIAGIALLSHRRGTLGYSWAMGTNVTFSTPSGDAAGYLATPESGSGSAAGPAPGRAR